MIKTNLNIDSIENNSIGVEKLSNSIQEQLIKIDEIETQVDENEDVTARALTDIDERIKELYPLKDKVNMFFDENGNVDDTIDSLKEIQHYFDNQGKEVVDLINNVNNLNEKVEGEFQKINQIIWDKNSNMDNFKEPGFYEIYGERTVISDNLPIFNTGSGHSFHANLTVLSSSLRPTNNEICITQFLTLSNRKGGDGNIYIRTYNQNNSPATNGWTLWQKLQGVKEGYIFTDNIQINPDGGVQEIEGITGLFNMVENGLYTGVYTDDPSLQNPSFIETFVLIVINNYSVVGINSQLTRQITQLKYAVDAISQTSTIQKRTYTGNGDGYKNGEYTEWEEIGGNKNEIESLKSLIQENEKVISTSLTDLNKRLNDLTNQLNDKRIIQINQNDYVGEILSNVKYIFTTPMTSIEISFLESDELYEEYTLIFQSQSDMVLSLPENVCWVNNEYPTIESGKIYELSVVKTKINNISYYKAVIVNFTPTN